MRYVSVAAIALAGMTSLAALAQAPASVPPASVPPASGARAGHEPGVGVSLPLSNRASNIRPNDTSTAIAPTLPTPVVGADATVQTYLRAARAALVAGRTGQAQQALEMAETRALDRSVPQGATDTPSHRRLIVRIGAARQALGAGDRSQALHRIDAALNTPPAG